MAFIKMQHVCLLLRPGSKFQRTMQHVAKCMKKYANTLRDLSK